MGTRATTERSDTWGSKAGEVRGIPCPLCDPANPGKGSPGHPPSLAEPCAGSGYSKSLKEMRDKSKDVVKMLLVVLI